MIRGPQPPTLRRLVDVVQASKNWAGTDGLDRGARPRSWAHLRPRCVQVQGAVWPVAVVVAGVVRRHRSQVRLAERVIGTLRRECLDRVVPLDERHLRTVLGECVNYDNRERPHRTLQLETPVPAARSPAGTVRGRPALGGLHHAYARAA